MQKIPFETLQGLTFGTSYTKIADGLLYFSRFSENEWNNVQPNEYYETKILSTAGVRLEFITDSRTLELETAAQSKSRQNRMFYAFDVVCDGKLLGQIRNFTEPPVYPYGDYPFDDQKGVFPLPAGSKHICIYFPFTVTGKIRSLSLDDGAALRPVTKKTKLLQYGDSITQGYDALYPSRTYASRLTDRLDADALNKGIAGSLFLPELVKDKPDFEPNLITVAYGTNDWNAAGDVNDFKRRCNAFFDRLAAHYPETPIAALSPIWRADCGESRALGSFDTVAKTIREAADRHENVFFIDGFDFVPHDAKCFRDSYLHPNDEGFAFYADALAGQLEKILK